VIRSGDLMERSKQIASAPDIETAILFLDPCCQRPYDTRTLWLQATPGTEASITRIADALGAIVLQHNRTETYGRFRPLQRLSGITHVILNRDPRALPLVRELFPEARVYLWVHDHFNPGSKRWRRLASMAQLLREMAVTIICVSNEQRHGVEAMLRHLRIEDRVTACTIYNPVDATDTRKATGAYIDDRKLVFFSSPNKGLKFTLDAFAELRRHMPDLRLVVGNPGYKNWRLSGVSGVEFLGPKPPQQIHQEVSTALCTFCPNFVLPETFGLVFAESKALGTPVLTHDCGAAAEIIADPEQVIPVTSAHRLYERLLTKFSPRVRKGPARIAAALGLFDPYVEKIRAWRSGARPVTGPDPRFRLTTVADQWRSLLCATDARQ
jgi:glycosyltransferase involved in cell wall biosynthesis